MFARLRPGDTPSYSEWNDLVDLVESMLRLGGNGRTEVSFGATGFQVYDLAPQPIWAKITAARDGNKFGWVPVLPQIDGTAPEVPAGGRIDGEPDSLPAIEVNGSRSVPPGTIVQLWPDLWDAFYSFVGPAVLPYPYADAYYGQPGAGSSVAWVQHMNPRCAGGRIVYDVAQMRITLINGMLSISQGVPGSLPAPDPDGDPSNNVPWWCVLVPDGDGGKTRNCIQQSAVPVNAESGPYESSDLCKFGCSVTDPPPPPPPPPPPSGEGWYCYIPEGPGPVIPTCGFFSDAPPGSVSGPHASEAACEGVCGEVVFP